MPSLVGGRIGSDNPAIIVSEVPLVIPADTWTEIPLPIGVLQIFDFLILQNDIDITSSVTNRQTAKSFEILSFSDLTTTIITQGV